MTLPARKTALNFLFCFACLFAGLSLPLPWVSSGVRHAATWFGNTLVSSAVFASGASLRFSDDAAGFTTTLWVSASDGRLIQVPIDLRLLGYLPIAAFVALALSTPLAWRARLRLLSLGLLFLVPLTALLIAAPLLTFLGGTGPIRVFELTRSVHAVLNVVYRALVAPPGMAFALPLVVWWLLLQMTIARFARPGMA